MQIFRMAVEEGFILRNPAELLFVPRDAKRAERPVMNREEVQKCFSVLELSERLMVKLGVLAGLRPGEIFHVTRRTRSTLMNEIHDDPKLVADPARAHARR